MASIWSPRNAALRGDLMPRDYTKADLERLRAALRGPQPLVSPEDDFAYGEGISPDATWRNLLPAVELGLSLAPGSGEAMSLRDAWDASGRGGNALLEGNLSDAASGYADFGTALLGAVPGAGMVARGTKRGAAWMDRNLPQGFNRLLDALYPADPRSTTNTFAGPTAKTADQAALAKAQEMNAQGASRDDIWRETGWGQGVDGKWRFEIDDSGSFYRGSRAAGSSSANEVFLHPELYDAYPALGRARVREGSVDAPESGSWYGGGPGHPTMTVLGPNASSTSVHEMQHGVQGIEGFSRGGSLGFDAQIRGHDTRFPVIKKLQDDLNEVRELKAYAAFKGAPPEKLESLQRAIQDRMDRLDKVAERIGYQNLAGEVEARNVQSRMNMTPAERRATPPWETQDVPDDQQIVRFR